MVELVGKARCIITIVSRALLELMLKKDGMKDNGKQVVEKAMAK